MSRDDQGCKRVVFAVAFVVWLVGCTTAVVPEPVEQRTGAVAIGGDAVLGFESTAGWTVSSGTASTTTTRTQGAAALSVSKPVGYTTLVSAPLASTLAGLAGLTDPGSTMAVDLLLPTQQPNQFYFGALQLYASIPSRNLSNVYLGQSELTGAKLGVYRTIKFAVPDSLRTALASGAVSDLSFTLALNAPAGATGKYLFDNLRARSPANPPPGARQSALLVALRTYTPAANTIGEAHFGPGVVQIPQSFHVKLGSAGTGTSKLEIGTGTTVAITCTYAASSDGASYVFSSCTGGALAGDLTPADFARLTIVAGAAAAGPTKIRAQLAVNPLGDEVGTGTLPAIPTFWGDTPDEINQIINAYSQVLNAAPKTEERFVDLPLGEFAQRHGDGSAVNLLDPNQPPPPNDPPFSFAGHMNPGSAWDAYWSLGGSMSSNDNGGSHHQSHFDASLSGHGVIWGFDVTVVSMNVAVDTDAGQVAPTGFTNPSTQGSLHMFLFGQELPGGGSGNAQSGFNFTVGDSRSFDAPTIHVWIFAVQAGVNASASVSAGGELRVDGFQINATPTLTVGAHLFGGVDIGIASGGVDVGIQLINVSTPFNAGATWQVSTNPAVCGATITFSASGQLVVSTLGGNVDLVAKFGVCPFCDHERWNLFSWSGVDLGSKPLFTISQPAAFSPLPKSLCRQNLVATIASPTPAQAVFNVTSTVLNGTVVQPPFAGTAVNGTGVGVPTQLDCNLLTWTSNDPSDTGFPAHGCSPVVTFGNAGPRHITLSATDSFGETGGAAVDLNVNELPGTGIVVKIVSPQDGTTLFTPVSVNLDARVARATGGVSTTWTIDGQMVGGGDPLLWSFVGGGTTVVTVNVSDAVSSASDTVTLKLSPPPK
jgi:hypothetical protein